MGVQELIASFQDTQSYIRQDPELARETQRAAGAGIIYPEGFTSARLYAMWNTAVEVLPGTSFAAAAGYAKNNRTAVLNFANPHYPGGGVRNGAMAQEECLCRSSNLYDCLTDEGVTEGFYQYHREKTDYFFSDRLIYSRGVTVFKDDSMVPRLQPRESWFQVDVITCAAPYLAKRKYTNRTVLSRLFMKRIRNILEAAIDNEVEVLILGAFGCGAFRNPPEVVAKAFYQVLQENRYRRAFSRVIFAIKPTGSACPNLAAFRKVFSGEEVQLPFAETELTMPGGRVLSGAEAASFRQWQKENPYYGKQFSVLGDSISTLEDYNPRGYRVFYQEQMCEKTGVREMKDTWWWKVIEFFGGELLVNNAWSGSMVARHPSQKDTFPSGCSSNRTGKLHTDGVVPDVIIVHMGVNDWANGISLTGPEGDDTAFRGAYDRMLRSVRTSYPNAEVWCCTLNETYMSTNPAFSFPTAFGGKDIRGYNQVIRETAEANSCKVLDLHSMGIGCDTVDGTHPTAAGMDTLAMMVIRTGPEQSGGRYLDCQGGRHDNTEIRCQDGSFRYVCRRCGAEYVLPPEPKNGATADAAPAVEEVFLQLYSRETGQTVRYAGNRIFAGRSKDCDLRLYSGYAARYQATFLCREGEWYIRDNNTKNGTYVNGIRLAPGMEVKLRVNDEISFAKQEAVVFRPAGQ